MLSILFRVAKPGCNECLHPVLMHDTKFQSTDTKIPSKRATTKSLIKNNTPDPGNSLHGKLHAKSRVKQQINTSGPSLWFQQFERKINRRIWIAPCNALPRKSHITHLGTSFKAREIRPQNKSPTRITPSLLPHLNQADRSRKSATK